MSQPLGESGHVIGRTAGGVRHGSVRVRAQRCGQSDARIQTRFGFATRVSEAVQHPVDVGARVGLLAQFMERLGLDTQRACFQRGVVLVQSVQHVDALLRGLQRRVAMPGCQLCMAEQDQALGDMQGRLALGNAENA